jgi:transcriptional regulator with XRE-family HTH domain
VLDLADQSYLVHTEMSIGENIRIKRERQGLTQKALAEAIGSGENTVAGWEKDKNAPPGDKVVRMAILFKCTTDEILLEVSERDVTEDMKALFRRFNDLPDCVKPTARNLISGVLTSLELDEFFQETVRNYVKAGNKIE